MTREQMEVELYSEKSMVSPNADFYKQYYMDDRKAFSFNAPHYVTSLLDHTSRLWNQYNNRESEGSKFFIHN